jgi:hypothetical protein
MRISCSTMDDLLSLYDSWLQSRYTFNKSDRKTQFSRIQAKFKQALIPTLIDSETAYYYRNMDTDLSLHHLQERFDRIASMILEFASNQKQLILDLGINLYDTSINKFGQPQSQQLQVLAERVKQNRNGVSLRNDLSLDSLVCDSWIDKIRQKILLNITQKL